MGRQDTAGVDVRNDREDVVRRDGEERVVERVRRHVVRDRVCQEAWF